MNVVLDELHHGTSVSALEGIKLKGFLPSGSDNSIPISDQVSCHFGTGVYFYRGDSAWEKASIHAQIKHGRPFGMVVASAECGEACHCDFQQDWLDAWNRARDEFRKLADDSRPEPQLRSIANWFAEQFGIVIFSFPKGRVTHRPKRVDFDVVVVRNKDTISIDKYQLVE